MADEIGAASAAGSSPASPAGSSATPPAPPASATATPGASAAASPAPAPQPSTGEPPAERWADILANTRTKTRSEVEAEYRQKYGWADQFQADPYAFVDRWIDQLAGHSQYGPQILAKAARMLQARRGAAAPATADEPQPNVPIVDTNGNVTGQTYSAEQFKKWQEWSWQQREAALNQRMQPIEQLHQQIRQHAQREQMREVAERETKSTLTELRAMPHFKEHEAAIKQALVDHEEWGDNVHRAYVHVLTSTVLPTLSQTEQAKVLDSLKTKAASGTVNPSGQTPAQTPKFKDFGEAARYYDAHPEEALAMARR
jgi:hypothetical protein